MTNILPKKKKQNRLKHILSYWQSYVLLAPALITTLIFHYYPIYGIQIAFKNFKNKAGIWGSKWVGLKHFENIINTMDPSVIINTITISLYSIAVFPCAIVFALMLNEVRNLKFKKTVQMVSYAPHFISMVVIVSLIDSFFARSNGLVNNVRELMGATRIDFMAKPEYFSSLYVWSGVWQNVGWDAIIYIAALSGVSQDLIEAARIDGANRLQIVWHVNIPHILPTMVTLLILRTGSVLSVGFEKIYLMQNALNLEASRVISTYVYEMGIRNGRMDYATAIGLLNNAVNVIVLLLVNKVAKTVSSVGLF